jgi:hypothetical protein
MGLLDDIAKVDKKNIMSKSDDNVVMYPTGITALDAANGFYQEMHTENGIERVPMYGITGGSFVGIIGTTGTGKSQPDDTLIPTPDGVKRLDELEIGDFVFDETGCPTRILGIFPQGMLDTYEVTFNDGRKTRCNIEHIWSIYKKDNYFAELENRTLGELLVEGNYDNYYIPVNGSIVYNAKSIDKDPYELGRMVKLTDEKVEPDDLNKLTEAIPEEYLYNIESVRLSVLKGILGITYDKIISEHTTFLTSWKKLAEDITTLARSLGFISNISPCFSYNMSTKVSTNRYIVNIRYPNSTIYTVDDDETNSYQPYIHREEIRIIDIKNLNIKTSQRCIYVDNPNHLYLTNDYIVTHNTTLATQIAWNIIKDFDDGVMYLIDAEKTSFKQRILDLCGCEFDDPRIKLIKNHTSIDDVQEMFNKICEVKEAGGDAYKYEVKDKSIDGKSFKAYIPTVFIIDSLPSFNAKDYNVDDLGNQIDQMRAAKDISRFYTNCLDRAWKYNITFLVINHIRPKTDTNPYAAPPKGLLMLGANESLPRGTVAQYYSQTYIRINSKKSDSYTMEDNGFTGGKYTMQLAKTKSNVLGASFPVAFISEVGFDPIYSLYEFANSIGLINGRNPYLYLKGLEEFKFNRKDFRNRIIENEAFRDAVMEVLRPYYNSLLSSNIKEDEEEREKPKFGYGDIKL